MKNGQSKWWKRTIVGGAVVGVLSTAVAWGKTPVAERSIVADNGGNAHQMEMKTEGGAQLSELVEALENLHGNCLSDANPVLVAYEQLSREMQRWFVFFAALGTFLGLLVPCLSYLLQIKAVDRHEEHVKREIQKAMGEAQKEMSKVIDIKVSAAHREMETVQAKVDEVAGKMPDLWKQHALYVKMIINELYQKVTNEWQHGRDGSEIGIGLVTFCNLLDECAFSSGDDAEMRSAADLVFRVFGGLHSDKNAPRQWKTFLSKISAMNSRISYGFHFTKDLLGAEKFSVWREYCAELGINDSAVK